MLRHRPPAGASLSPVLLALVFALLSVELFALMSVVLDVATQAHAHHPGSMADRRQPRAPSGAVRALQWTNPHS
jgi:hypothetical protein